MAQGCWASPITRPGALLTYSTVVLLVVPVVYNRRKVADCNPAGSASVKAMSPAAVLLAVVGAAILCHSDLLPGVACTSTADDVATGGGVVALSCEQRGYTLCADACCGRNSTNGEALCCLETRGATCCNRPSLAEQGNRFFCCPASMPVCDFDAGTCRPSQQGQARAAAASNDGDELEGLFRAYRAKPRRHYQGHSFSSSSNVLNKHLHQNIASHGLSADRILKPCSEFSAEDLYTLQTNILSLRAFHLDTHYQKKKDRRRLRFSSLDDFHQQWKTIRDMVTEFPNSKEAVLSGFCHEAVMWYIHHLHRQQQKKTLETSVSIPYLPETRFFQPGNTDAAPPDLSDLPEESLEHVRRVYVHQIGCGACHIANVSVLPPNATHCPVPVSVPCMNLGQLHCNSSAAQGAYQCCPGLVCEPVYIPASEVAFSLNTTRCAVSADIRSAFSSSVEGITPPTADTHMRKDVNTIRDTAAPPPAPVLPASWIANGTYYNLTADDPSQPAGTVNFMYQEHGFNNQTTIRLDFGPVCPFKQLWKRGLESNYVPCTVLFRNSTVLYAYQGQHACVYCSEDSVTAWHRDFLCSAASTLRSNISISLHNAESVTVDEWRFEWWTTIFLVLRNYRNWFFVPGTNTPVRVSEDLDTGYTDFDQFTEVPAPGLSDEELTRGLTDLNVSYVAGLHGTRPCPGPDERQFVKPDDLPECIFVQAIPIRRTWPQREWPEGWEWPEG